MAGLRLRQRQIGAPVKCAEITRNSMLWRATAVQAATTGSERGCPVFFAVLWLADHFLIELLCGDVQMVGTEANELVACRSVRFGFFKYVVPSLAFRWEPNPKSLLCAIAAPTRSH